MTAPTRGQTLAAALAGPAVAAAVLLVVFDGWRTVAGRSPLVAEGPSEAAFVEALRSRDVEAAFALVRAGQSMDAPVDVSDATLTGGVVLRVRPLVLAVASDNENGVSMLLSNGIHMDIDGNRKAACLADHLGYRGMADAIRRASRSYPRVSCPERGVDTPLLSSYAEP